VSVRAWWAGGERVAVPGGRVFVRVDGPADAPLVTLLHGFPTSSYDWAAVVARLRDRRRPLALDFLGFGDSDKPGRYSLLRQAGVVQAVWARLGVERTELVAHDYGVSVAQELLARRTDVEIARLALLNGGLIPALHRPLPVQGALAHPLTGPLLARDALGGGAPARGHAARARVGPEDPVSGAHMLAEVRRRRPDAAACELAGVGHYPQLEAPDETAAALVDRS